MVSDRKSTRLNSSHTVIYTLSLHDALPICCQICVDVDGISRHHARLTFQGYELTVEDLGSANGVRSEEHTSELQSHRDLHSFPTRRSSDLLPDLRGCGWHLAAPRAADFSRLRTHRRGSRFGQWC